ncbi:hypothetical protein FDI24_gp076 [Acidovorax phage ACP17]|uniref:Baseplate wedge subunit n=1 Tax=Acidovorax phage ACP17 TaxID=2010329 RepID=A0A218M2T7_9CAUD|nr:hypothetical protein FDI24_gp076 [Acidovorax phage ACP17]ASD50355.1 hypothetical protein [Acidovorax phage ACP17]
MAKRDPIYSDLDLNMVAHPLTGDLTPKTDLDAVRQSIRSLFFLDAFDYPFDSYRQSNLRKLLFEPASQLTESRIRTNLEWLIKKVEPRVNLERIDVEGSSDGLGYHITVWYAVKSIMASDSYKFFVQRVR